MLVRRYRENQQVAEYDKLNKSDGRGLAGGRGSVNFWWKTSFSIVFFRTVLYETKQMGQQSWTIFIFF